MNQLLSIQLTVNTYHPNSESNIAKLNEFKELMQSKLVIPNIEDITVSDDGTGICLDCDVLFLDKIQPTVDFLVKGTLTDEDPEWLVDYEVKHVQDPLQLMESFLQPRFKQTAYLVGKQLKDGSVVIAHGRTPFGEEVITLKTAMPTYALALPTIFERGLGFAPGYRLWNINDYKICKSLNLPLPIGTPIFRTEATDKVEYAYVDSSNNLYTLTKLNATLLSADKPYYFSVRDVPVTYLKSIGEL